MTKPVLYAVIGGVVSVAVLGGLIFWLRGRSVDEGGVTATSPSTETSETPRAATPSVGLEELRKNDSDLDGLSNQEEQSLGTDPTKSDTDGDAFTDYEEVKVMKSDPKKADPITASGRPGLENYQGQGSAKPDVRPIEEIRGTGSSQTPAPTASSTIAPGSGPSDDPDQDGLTNQQEATYKTDPKNPDSDGDGFNDAQEIEKGYNPLGSGMCATPTCIP